MSDLSPILFGVSSSTCFGAGDFTGGFVTKKNNVFLVLLISQIIGFSLLLISALVFQEGFPTASQVFFALLAGTCGGVGLLSFYQGLSLGKAATVAPITAVITPITPLVVNFIQEPLWEVQHLLGFAVGMTAIWFVSNSKTERRISLQELKLPVLAGLGFGSFQTFIHFASTETSYFFPLVFARTSSLAMVFTIILLTKRYHKVTKQSFALISLTGVLDTLGNLFFVLSSQTGRLDVAALLSSFGPAVVVFLAFLVVKEKINRVQFLGLVLSLVSVLLFST